MYWLNKCIFLFLLLISGYSYGQISQDSIDAYNLSIENYRKGINIKLMYSDKTPLKPEQQKSFTGLNYFPVDISYVVKATLTKNDKEELVIMRTSTDRAPEYLDYGYVEFEIDGKKIKLSAFQNVKQKDMVSEEMTLFIPFRDETCGNESYGGGRYIECQIPETGNEVYLDFNKAYNPYCAYNSRFSCVIPPEENRMSVRIEAGEMIFEKH